MPDRVVLDAGAVLAHLEDEPGADIVGRILESGIAWMNLVNLGEVTYILERELGTLKADQTFAELSNEQPVDGRPPINWIPVDSRLVRQASRFKALGGLSYADAFAAASAALLDCPVVVCQDDEEFKAVERLGIAVHWIP
jgi:PIN domain nuclease of toxin-antitoxin system